MARTVAPVAEEKAPPPSRSRHPDDERARVDEGHTDVRRQAFEVAAQVAQEQSSRPQLQRHHARFLPPRQLEMMVQGGHSENAAAQDLEREDLRHHRERLGHEHGADDREEELALDEHRHGAERGAEREGARIPHEDVRGIAVPPEKPERGPDDGGAEDRQLSGVGDVRHLEVSRELHVPRDVAHPAERHRGNAVSPAGVQAIPRFTAFDAPVTTRITNGR